MAKHPAKCPKCGHRVDYDSAVGDHIVCAHCQAALAVPGKGKRPQAAGGRARTSRPPQVEKKG